jgi:DNA repair photolyase
VAKVFEQGTPLVSKRIQSLHWLQENGFRTFGIICPSLPQTDMRQFAHDMAEALRYDRCEHVWAEVINARGESFTRTYNALVAGGFTHVAADLKAVSEDKRLWEQYAHETFLMHAQVCPPGKLRFLQYVTRETVPWWHRHEPLGAVLLGKAAEQSSK